MLRRGGGVEKRVGVGGCGGGGWWVGGGYIKLFILRQSVQDS